MNKIWLLVRWPIYQELQCQRHENGSAMGKDSQQSQDSSALEKATLMGKYDTHLENISVLQINMIFKK